MHLLVRLFSSRFSLRKFSSNLSRKIIAATRACLSPCSLRSSRLTGLLAAMTLACMPILAYGTVPRPRPMCQGWGGPVGTIAVTSTADVASDTTTGSCASGGACTLREAINQANADNTTTTIDSCGGGTLDTIQFSVSGTITLAGALPSINDYVTITGPASGAGLTVDGSHSYTVFSINSGATVSISGLTIVNGNGSYGGIANYGALTVANSTFSGNSAILGGAIFNNGTLTVTNSTFSGNSASGGDGGAIENEGTLTVANSTFSGNSATGYGFGGAIANHATATVTNSIFSGNSATQWGGGIDDFTAGVHASYNVYSKNTDSGGGGDCNYCGSNTNAVYDDPMLLPLGSYGGPTQTMYPMGGAVVCAGSASLAVDASGNPLTTDQRGQPLAACPNGRVTVGAVQPVYLVVNTSADSDDGSCTSTTCSLRDAINAANSGLGADIVFDASLAGKTLTLSSALSAIRGRLSILGAGASQLTVSGGGTVGVMFTVASGTVALFDGLTLASGNTNFTGGAVRNNGTLTVANSTFSGNSASYDGGAIANYDALTVANSTFSGNSAFVNGGAIFSNSGTLTVTNSTFFGNSAEFGGAIYNNNSTVTVVNNIFSGNSASSSGGGIDDQLNGVQASNNVFWNNTGGDCSSCASNTNPISGDPVLAALGSYGGPTQTMPPQAGSAALNAGIYQAGEPTTDQRGAPRPGSGAIDAGAVQISGNPPMLGAATPAYGPIAGGTSVTLTGTGLDTAASVLFGSVAGTISSQSFTSLTAVSPAASSAGTVQITASNGSGTIPFTYYAPLALSPASGSLTASYGATFSETFAVSGGSGSYTLTLNPGTLPGSLTLSCSGSQCTLSGTATQTGSFSFTLTANDATYSGVTSASATYTLTVQATPSVSLSAASLTYGQSGGQIGVTLAPPSGLSTVPSGTVQCSIDSGTATTATLSNGVANIPVASTLSAGSHSLQCSYSGDTNYTTASFTSNLTITKAAATMSVSASAAAVFSGQPITLTASVASATTGAPTGSVSFYDGSTLLSTVALSGAQATLTATTLGVGTHTITATYSGDGNFNTATASTSAATTVLSSDFTLSNTGVGGTQTVIPGNAATFSFSVTPASGTFAAPVSFSVAGLPPGATATFSLSSLPASSTGGQVQLTIQTAKSSTTASLRRISGGAALALLLFPLLGTRRMRHLGRTAPLALFLFAGVVLGLSGCGAGSGLFAQPAQNYSVTVTVTSGSVQHTIDYTLNLQ